MVIAGLKKFEFFFWDKSIKGVFSTLEWGMGMKNPFPFLFIMDLPNLDLL